MVVHNVNVVFIFYLCLIVNSLYRKSGKCIFNTSTYRSKFFKIRVPSVQENVNQI